MNQRQLASVLFAVVGVFIAATRIPELFSYFRMLVDWVPASGEPAAIAFQRQVAVTGLIATIIALLVGSCLVVFRHRLADRLFAVSTQPLVAREAQAVALSVLGCYFVVAGISRIGAVREFDWSAAVQLVLGVALFFGARGLSGLWSMFRSVGRSHSVPDSVL